MRFLNEMREWAGLAVLVVMVLTGGTEALWAYLEGNGSKRDVPDAYTRIAILEAELRGQRVLLESLQGRVDAATERGVAAQNAANEIREHLVEQFVEFDKHLNRHLKAVKAAVAAQGRGDD